MDFVVDGILVVVMISLEVSMMILSVDYRAPMQDIDKGANRSVLTEYYF